jgi:microsomal dipeptidase-like Zn-dependent dipeptidase
MNFLRAYLHPTEPESLTRHILHAIRLGGEASVCLGADYFATSMHPDSDRHPFYFAEHANAGCYPTILEGLNAEMDPEYIEALACSNAARFIKQLWG